MLGNAKGGGEFGECICGILSFVSNIDQIADVCTIDID